MPIKILAVDDSLTMRQALEITFAGEDAEIITLDKGADVVARAVSERPDIILVDARLGAGDLSGSDVCGAIRAEASIAQTPIIWMMPDREGVSDQKAKNVGASAAIGKPFDSQALIDLVSSVSSMQIKPAAAAVAPSVPKAPARPAASAPARPAAVSRPAAPASRPATPAARPVTPARPATPVRPAASASPASAPAASIPLAVPIPFTSANAPTSGMLKRIEAAVAGKAVAGESVSPEAMKALAALSHEVVERIAWEVVPELAETIIREQRAAAGQ